MKKPLSLFICLIPLILFGQKIDITLPQDANKEYVFILNKGIKQDTIQRGNLSFSGTVTINIPDKDKNYKGIGALLIKDAPTFNMVINKENFSVEKGTDGKYKFIGSPENQYLYSIIQREGTPQADSALYATHFVDIIKYMQQLNRINTQGGGLKDRAAVRLYALDNLDMEDLYTSSLWFHVIDGFMKMSVTQEAFGEDMAHILKRIKSQEVFDALADNLLTITDQYGMDDAFDIIVPYLKESGRIAVPQGKMFAAFALAKIKKGTIPPAIIGLKPSLEDSDAKHTLIVFYQPDCENCHTQLELLMKDYIKLKEQGIRVISISGGNDKKEFESEKNQFPWEDKLCDFEGYAGPNFINYGIMGTPIFFLLNKDKKVVKRYALFTDIDFINVAG